MKLKNMDISSGKQMIQLGVEELFEQYARQTSKWLAMGQPHTKPRSYIDLILEAGSSWYAVSTDCLVGHITLKKIGDWPLPSTEEGKLFTGPHPVYEIGSLVVNPDFQGQGVASRLVGFTVDNLAETFEVEHTGSRQTPDKAALFTVACEASLGVFEVNGFTSDPVSPINLLVDAMRTAEDLETSGAGKFIVSRFVESPDTL